MTTDLAIKDLTDIIFDLKRYCARGNGQLHHIQARQQIAADVTVRRLHYVHESDPMRVDGESTESACSRNDTDES
ncbi:hypothetical protein CYMTET_38022 [Cymbomonas tetramitiformis]|uniref:Uncharacterized protein n=1 Tax=Cymbomonas tetramitiformis TaxID=36881 RepID=A0AAE0CE52_9CHLO|nr:hypothetical protein CYMTET_38022 [Cymbomonas tetramitiformis]